MQQPPAALEREASLDVAGFRPVAQSAGGRRRLHGQTHGAADAHQVFLEATLPHLDAVHNVARRFARDGHHADDLVQETYLRAFAAFATHDRRSTRSWLVAICLNAARSDGRRARVRAAELLVADNPEPTVLADDVGDAAAASWDRDAIVRALTTIPDEQRVAVVMMDIAGLTAQEVADALGCPRGTVLARVHRGRRKLAVELERDGIRP